jgi:hypothetical protein
MNNYVPFLKFKANEVHAISTLSPEIKSIVFPFFDFAKKKGMTANTLSTTIEKAVTSASRHLKNLSGFYLDNFDLDDSIQINGRDNYEFVISSFDEIDFVPVVGLDRTNGRNQIVFDAKKNNKIISDTIAIRLQFEDFEDFELIEDELGELMAQGHNLFENWTLVLDNRECFQVDAKTRANHICRFLESVNDVFEFSKIIIAGSSIPASIGNILDTKTELTHNRNEIQIYSEVINKVNSEDLYFGDYTIVSPQFSDVDLIPEMMQTVTAPKVLYSYENVHYIVRGGTLKHHARGLLQYNDIAVDLIKQTFFRGALYSYGDNFLVEKANFQGKNVMPGSILKPTINAHITYMVRDFSV